MNRGVTLANDGPARKASDGKHETSPTDNECAPYKTTVLFKLSRGPEKDCAEGVESEAEMDAFLQRRARVSSYRGEKAEILGTL